MATKKRSDISIDSVDYKPRNKKEAAYLKANPYSFVLPGGDVDEAGGADISIRTPKPPGKHFSTGSTFDDGREDSGAGAGRGKVNRYKAGGTVKRGWGKARGGKK